MTFLEKLALVLTLWAVMFVICNPFFQNRKMVIASIVFAAGASVAWLST